MPNQKQSNSDKNTPGVSGYVPRKTSARQKYRLEQRERIDASPVIQKKFPRLKALRVTLEFFDAAGRIRHGEMKCELNVKLARAALWFACPGVDCMCGDFDLSGVLAEAVSTHKSVTAGELRCQGTRKRGDRKPVSCGTLLHYKLKLTYG